MGWGREGGVLQRRSYLLRSIPLSVRTLRKRLATPLTVIIEEIGTLQMPQETKEGMLLKAKDLKKELF